MKTCDHTSVGILVWQNNKLLLIERKKFPYGFAPPAGHVDSDKDFEAAAKRELQEEVGLEVKNLELIAEGRKDNKCRRQDGTWHYWKVYKASAMGDLRRSLEETKSARWFHLDEIKELSQQTEDYLKGVISDEAWQRSPGIEPVWYEWFKKLEIL